MVNTLIECGLESQAQSLKAKGFSDYQIAAQLSELSGAKITRSAVFRYFKDNNEALCKVAIQNERIITRTIEEKFNTIQARIRVTNVVIDSINQLSSNPELYGKEIAALSKVAIDALDSVDDKTDLLVSPSPGTVDYSLGVTLTDAELLKAIELTESGSS